MEKMKTTTDEVLQRLCEITPMDVVEHCKGNPVVLKGWSYDPTRKSLLCVNNGYVCFDYIWRLNFSVRVCEKTENGFNFSNELIYIPHTESIVKSGCFDVAVSKNVLRKLKNKSKDELVAYVLKNFGEYILLKATKFDYISIVEVKSPNDYKKDKSVMLYKLKKAAEERQTIIDGLKLRLHHERITLNGTKNRISEIKEYENNRMRRFTDLPKYIYVGNIKDTQGKRCDCYYAREDKNGWRVLFNNISSDDYANAVIWLSQKIKSNTNENGFKNVWLVTGNAVGVCYGGCQLANIVPIKNLSEQMEFC